MQAKSQKDQNIMKTEYEIAIPKSWKKQALIRLIFIWISSSVDITLIMSIWVMENYNAMKKTSEDQQIKFYGKILT
jgi:hypothetical protein